MPRAHRLDSPGYDPNATAEGFVTDVKKADSRQPDDKRYPKGADTNYVHDQQATVSTSPGPFHGDDLVSQQESQDIRHRRPVHTVLDNEDRATKTKLNPRTFNAVPVQIVDTLVKNQSIRHQVMVQEVQQGTAVRVLGKDPTRTAVRLHVSGGNGYICNPNIEVALADAVAQQFFFPIPTSTASPLSLNTEEEIWVYCPSDATGTCYVQIYAEYARGINTREEFYDAEN
jgi:hypothetical protein